MAEKDFTFKKRENPFDKLNAKVTESKPKIKVQVAEREKYTATMDKHLRMRIKIAAVKKGKQLSEYIEEAVLQKLEREGD